MYKDIIEGAVLTVVKSDIHNTHESQKHPGQDCFRGSCDIEWEHYKKKVVIVYK